MNLEDVMIIQLANGTNTFKEMKTREAREQVELSYDRNFDCENVQLNGSPSQLLITKMTDENIKKIKARPSGNFELGDNVEWQNAHWLVTSIDADDRINRKGRMTRCNILLRWLNSKGDIIERWGVGEDATKYDSGKQQNTYITTGLFQLKIKIHLDKETILLRRDKRFLIDADGYVPDLLQDGKHPNAFKLSRDDAVVNAYDDIGCYTLTLMLDQFSESRDNADLMIADYYLPKYYLEFINVKTPLDVNINTPYQLEVEASKDGVTIPISEIQFSSSDESIATVSTTGLISGVSLGSCFITAKVGDNDQSLPINVVAGFPSSSYNISIISPNDTSFILSGGTLDLQVPIYNRGQLVTNQDFYVEVRPTTGWIVVESKTWNSVTLKATDRRDKIGSSIILKVYNPTLNIEDEKEFTIKGLY